VRTATDGSEMSLRLMVVAFAISGRPSRIRPTSKLVPPMSVVTMSRCPRNEPMNSQAITPPTGPDITVDAASRSISDTGARPPFDCISRGSDLRPLLASFDWRLSTAVRSVGRRLALIAVVTVRRYSPSRGRSALDVVTSAPGTSSSISSAIRHSWESFLNDQSREIAYTSAPASRSLRIAARASSSSSGMSTRPW